MQQSQARRNRIARKQGDHSHSYAQILLGWRGTMNCEFQHSGHRLQAGSAALVPQREAHLYKGLSDNCELLVIDLASDDPYIDALEQACEHSLGQTLFAEPGLINLSAAQLPLLDFAAQRLNQAAHNSLVQTQLISLFITELCLQLATPPQAISDARLNRQQLDQLIDSLHPDRLDNLSLAQRLNLSESHFYCLCQQTLGMAPQQYIRQRRLLMARQQLLASDIPLKVLAQQVGFADSSSFCRAFRRQFNTTPGQLRRSRQA